ncbi:MAG: hypothetical protein R6U37_04090 [Dehalococcoidia bacterium]
MKRLSITLIVIVAIFLVGGCSDSEEPLSSFEASITPDAPTTTDDLVVNIVTPEDWENETITYEYKWYLDGVPQPSLNTNRVPSTQTAKGQTWQVEVTPVKDKAPGPSIEESVYVRNTPPAAPVISIFPVSASLVDDLSVNFETPSIDPDEDQVTYRYEWFKESSSQDPITTPLLDSSQTSTGDTWQVVVTPTDGEAEGPSGNARVTLGNSRPTQPVVSIQPQQPLTYDYLTANIIEESIDPEGDTIIYEYEWYKNGYVQPAFKGTSIPPSSTKAGDLWKVVVIPRDEMGAGQPGEDSIRIAEVVSTDPVGDVQYSPEPGNPADFPATCDITGVSMSVDGQDCLIEIMLDELPPERYPHQAASLNPDYQIWISIDLDNNPYTGIQTSGDLRKGEEYYIKFNLQGSPDGQNFFDFPEDMHKTVLVPHPSNPYSAQTPASTDNLTITVDRQTGSLLVNDPIPGISTNSRFTVYITQFIGEISAYDFATSK